MSASHLSLLALPLLLSLTACDLADSGISVVRTDTGFDLVYDDASLTDVVGDVGLPETDTAEAQGSVAACGDASADRTRLVLAGPSHDPLAYVLQLSPSGSLSNTGQTVSLVGDPTAMAFSPNGEVALVGTRRNDSAGFGVFELSSYQVDGTRLTLVDTFEIDGPVEQILTSPDGRRAIVTGQDSTDEAGIFTLDLACDGTLTPRPDAHFPLRLVGSMAWLDPGERLVVSGGQVVFFEPQESQDLWILDWTGSGWSVAASYDFWDVSLLATEISLSSDGRRLIVPNHFPAEESSGRVHVYDVNGSQVTQRAEVAVDRGERSVLSGDGATLFMTQPFANSGIVLGSSGSSYREERTLGGLLMGDIAAIERGSLTDSFLIDAINTDDDPIVQHVRFQGAGVVLGDRVVLPQATTTLAVQP